MPQSRMPLCRVARLSRRRLMPRLNQWGVAAVGVAVGVAAGVEAVAVAVGGAGGAAADGGVVADRPPTTPCTRATRALP